MCRWALDDEKLQQRNNDQQKQKPLSMKDKLKLILLKQTKSKSLNKEAESKINLNQSPYKLDQTMRHPNNLDRSFEKLYQKFI